eukprot:TRINITY_DN19194_c0_g1_i1.p1 TRINITY_DN19194_c0_g1~~TRINITY_DN19194_c0_g1_i1.p1  ORF type:complete len:262 (+),score=25.64 TRINITY_DN19194_c0_g1_i1:73-858(+)
MSLATLATVALLTVLPPPPTMDIVKDHIQMDLPAGPGSHRVDVYYPEDLNKGPFPLVSFAHGMLAGGPTGRPVYKNIIAEIAARGIIVVAPESCLLLYCDNFYRDQLFVINATRNHTLHKAFEHIDHNSVGVLGHSMGGQATEQSAGHLGYGIKAAAAVHPVSSPEWGRKIVVPTLYTTGDLDVQAPAFRVREAYHATNVTGTIYADLRGANHYEPTNLGQGRLDRYVATFFSCILAGNHDDCKWNENICSAYDYVHCESK